MNLLPDPSLPTAPPTEAELREMFDENYECLRLESGHSLAADVREAAWQQVSLYWRKLGALAAAVTDTEVKLNLPDQVTPKARRFCIEGVVDIVREEEKVTMYDIKTHALEDVRKNIGFYRDQLNVYAHIWRNLRCERLDETAVIATPLPSALAEAVRSDDAARIEESLAEWEPVVPIAFDLDEAQRTIGEFARVVDAIEDGAFEAPPPADLQRREHGRSTFASRVCVNCDVRFSCQSYREHTRRTRTDL